MELKISLHLAKSLTASLVASKVVLEEAAIVITPGSAFGEHGEGYFRIALTVTSERFEEVIKRFEQIKL